MTDTVKAWIEGRQAEQDEGGEIAVHAELAMLPRALGALNAVLEVLSPHYDDQVRREAKFGRVGSACVCEICRSMEAIEGAINGERG